MTVFDTVRPPRCATLKSFVSLEAGCDLLSEDTRLNGQRVRGERTHLLAACKKTKAAEHLDPHPSDWWSLFLKNPSKPFDLRSAQLIAVKKANLVDFKW